MAIDKIAVLEQQMAGTKTTSAGDSKDKETGEEGETGEKGQKGAEEDTIVTPDGKPAPKPQPIPPIQCLDT